MKTEYLFRIDKHKGKYSSKETFLKSLFANDRNNIIMQSNIISYYGYDYSYEIQENIIDGNYLLLDFIIECSKDIDLNDSVVKKYIELTDYIQKIINALTDKIECLWNDINFHCSKTAYYKIYEIENLFRKILTKIMYLNLGRGWEELTLSQNLSKNVNSSKLKHRDGGLLYKLDFIDINDYLFKEVDISSEIVLNKLEEKLSCNKPITKEDLEFYRPKSNWDRIVREVVGKKVTYNKIQEDWKTLYSYRNEIAHNNILFTPAKLKETENLINSVKPKLEFILSKMDSKKFDSENICLCLSEIQQRVKATSIIKRGIEILKKFYSQTNDDRFLKVQQELEFVLENKDKYQAKEIRDIGIRYNQELSVIIKSFLGKNNLQQTINQH